MKKIIIHGVKASAAERLLLEPFGIVLSSKTVDEAITAMGEMYRHHGLHVVIENQKGSVRRGIGANGERWASVLAADYGYIRRIEGEDGEPLDCFVGEDYGSDQVTVIRQIDPATSELDEFKVMLAFSAVEAATRAYAASYSDDPWPRVGGVIVMPMDEFKSCMSDLANLPW